MQRKLNRELKAYCADFATVRCILRDRGAVFVEVKDQVDNYYRLPNGTSDQGTRRLKLRFEKGTGTLIYYCDQQEAGARTSHVQMSEVADHQMGELLEAALGTKAVVRKQRELWRDDNVIFNLDIVEGVGQILEVEVRHEVGRDIDAQPNEYRLLFGPYLGGYVSGSNEDLVIKADS